MTTTYLPQGHAWEEVYVKSNVGVEYMWECKCGASFHVCHDQTDTTTTFEEGDGSCDD